MQKWICAQIECLFRFRQAGNAGPSRSTAWRSFLLAGIMLFFASIGVSVGKAAENGATEVSLGDVAGPPKGIVMVPVYLSPDPPSREVGKIAATISFKNEGVAFLRAEKGFLLDGVGGKINVETKNDAQDPNKLVLAMEVVTEGEPRKALREGLVLTLVFQIAEGAAPDTKVALAVENVSATDIAAPPKAIEPVAGKNGTIEIISPDAVPYIACFFFTH
ncbi:MAG: hypothetical protein HY649_04920 [Acidobacteria bacterium]|nr:hypothetical protein [Acidobacteriota bacterium]